MVPESLNLLGTLNPPSVTVPTIGDVKSAFRTGIPQVLSAMVKNLLLISTATISPFLMLQEVNENDHNLNHAQAPNEAVPSWMFYANMALVPCGAVVSGFITNWFGTQLSMQIVLGLLIVIRALNGIYTTGWQFSLTVIGINLCCEFFKGPVLSHMAETAQPHLRGALTATACFAMVVGQLQQLLLNAFVTPTTATYINCTLPLICIVLLCVVPESPQSLIMSNQLDKARKSLAWLRGWAEPKEIEPEFQEMLAHCKPVAALQNTAGNVKKVLESSSSALSNDSIATNTSKLSSTDSEITSSLLRVASLPNVTSKSILSDIADISNVSKILNTSDVTSELKGSKIADLIKTDIEKDVGSLMSNVLDGSNVPMTATAEVANTPTLSNIVTEAVPLISDVSSIPEVTDLLDSSDVTSELKGSKIADLVKTDIEKDVGSLMSNVLDGSNVPITATAEVANTSTLSNIVTAKAPLISDVLSIPGVTDLLGSSDVTSESKIADLVSTDITKNVSNLVPGVFASSTVPTTAIAEVENSLENVTKTTSSLINNETISSTFLPSNIPGITSSSSASSTLTDAVTKPFHLLSATSTTLTNTGEGLVTSPLENIENIGLNLLNSSTASSKSIPHATALTNIMDLTSNLSSKLSDISAISSLPNLTYLTSSANIPNLATSTLTNVANLSKLANIPNLPDVQIIEEGLEVVTNINKFLSRAFLLPLAIVTFTYLLVNFTGTTILLNQPERILITLKAPIDPKYAVIILTGANLIGTSLSISAITYFGKRNLTFISLSGVGLCSFAISAYSYYKNIKYDDDSEVMAEPLSLDNFLSYNWIPLVILLMLTTVSHFGLSNLPVLLVGELFSKETRAIGTGLSNGITSYISSICNSVLVLLLATLDFSGLYCFYGVVSFAGIVILHFILPETEGKTLEEIENHFKGVLQLGNVMDKITKPLSNIKLNKKE